MARHPPILRLAAHRPADPAANAHLEAPHRILGVGVLPFHHPCLFGPDRAISRHLPPLPGPGRPPPPLRSPVALLLFLPILAALLWLPAPAAGRPAVAVAAAANFVHALEPLHAEFRRVAPDVVLTAASGASGSLFAQIAQGAPFDVFLSADTEYPLRAVADGLAPRASYRVVATGRLVFWTLRTDLDLSTPAAALRSPALRRLALAQPRTAPYGRAALAILTRFQVDPAGPAPRLVYGENITQTAQFVETGAADAGFVALSLVRSPRLARAGTWVELAPELHPDVSLDHAAVLTMRGARNPAATRYLEFLASAPAKMVLRDFGYAVP
jgi:molybdate transport system substrate-binding protein